MSKNIEKKVIKLEDKLNKSCLSQSLARFGTNKVGSHSFEGPGLKNAKTQQPPQPQPPQPQPQSTSQIIELYTGSGIK